ncbi:TetR/AcrR family transcriptional regulator C-terminal domain-containing protein [Nonomuraea sp. NPDC049625]|uniref:TetR/AcrR family transcriptional regulator C-terminal domain-containing protein n=1 Tax=Nonomuraea sp. NPDC049625 TaxID=3155775 RepID=UPI003449E945
MAGAHRALCVGSVQFNLGVDSGDPEEQRMRRRLYGSLAPHQYPVLVAHAEELSRVGSRDEFEFGLAALLDAIEARITPRS